MIQNKRDEVQTTLGRRHVWEALAARSLDWVGASEHGPASPHQKRYAAATLAPSARFMDRASHTKSVKALGFKNAI
jgi:dihydroorotase-like cyclic amidohydrolase